MKLEFCKHCLCDNDLVTGFTYEDHYVCWDCAAALHTNAGES